MRIGFSELVLIVVIVLALFKPDKLNEYAAGAGRVVRKFIDDTKPLNDSVNEVKQTLNKTIEPVTSIQDDIHAELAPDQTNSTSTNN